MVPWNAGPRIISKSLEECLTRADDQAVPPEHDGSVGLGQGPESCIL